MPLGVDGVGSAAVFVYYSDFTVLVILTFKGVRVLNPCVYRGLRCTPQGVRVW